jgi:hypothetical protein
MEKLNLSATFSVSARTEQFLSELNKELALNNWKMTSFEPSEKLKNSFGLIKQGNIWLISGFIKTSEHFDKSALEQSGVSFGQPAGQHCTVNIPLHCLSEFLKHPAIDYFEISEQVQLK